MLLQACVIPDNMGPFIFSAKDEDDLVRLNETVSELYAHDGGDCPEYGMTAIFETLTEVLPYSNIIVLTDAAAKDDHYKSRIIHTANRKNNSIHFFLSSSSCVTANTSLQHYRDIANETDGIVVDSITDFGLLTTFSKTLREKLSVGHVADKRKRSSIISVIFHASVFTESINILFTKFITDITITTPEGNIIPVSTSGSLASYNKDKPPPGKYIVSSSREFEYRILLPSNCDVLVEHYGNKSIKLVKGMYIRSYEIVRMHVKAQNNYKSCNCNLLCSHRKQVLYTMCAVYYRNEKYIYIVQYYCDICALITWWCLDKDNCLVRGIFCCKFNLNLVTLMSSFCFLG